MRWVKGRHVDERVDGVEAGEEEVAVRLQARQRQKRVVAGHEAAVGRDGLRDVYEVEELGTGELVDDGETPRWLE